jgi:class 3 adenylate cyclase
MVRGLRAKLFVSVGVILCLVALMNYLFPFIFMRRDLDRATVYVNKHFDQIQQNVLNLSSFLITNRLVEGVAKFYAMVEMSATDQLVGSSWELGEQIATYDSRISFIQIGSDVVSLQDGVLYAPEWAPFTEGMLWIRIPEKNEVFVAVPDPHMPRYYLLFKEETLKKATIPLKEPLLLATQHFTEGRQAPFIPLKIAPTPISPEESAQELFGSLLARELYWLDKIDFLKMIAPLQDKAGEISADGAVKLHDDKKVGLALLTEDIFSTSPIITGSANDGVLFLLMHAGIHEQDLNLIKPLLINNQPVYVALSISSILTTVSQLLQKTVIITAQGGLSLGLASDGTRFNPQEVGFPLDALKSTEAFFWQDQKFLPYKIDIDVLTLFVLIPEKEATAIAHFLGTIQDRVNLAFSLNLMGAALLSMIIAFLLLNKIAQRITHPITLLSNAFGQLERGEYEEIVLPELGKRKDEVAVLTHSFEKMVSSLQDRDRIRGVLNKVVSKEISEEILKHNIELGGEERTLTMLFSDIRGFTHFSENLQPRLLVSVLNAYMTRMCRIIDETKGVVDKFVGDEIMALYGAPLALMEHASKGVEAALLMIQDLRQWNEERKKSGEPLFEVGIGVHTGIVCTGNMGAENRLNYTVVGANVNLAARLCSAAAPMQILISKETAEMPDVRGKFQLKELPPITLKGIDHLVSVYEVLGFLNPSQ